MKIRLCVLAIFTGWCLVSAQEIGDYISKYASANGKGYMQPLADVFGANLNSGLFQANRLPKAGFRLNLGVKAVATSIGDAQRVFSAKTEEPFSPATTAKVPTVFGKPDPVSVTGTGGTIYNFPGGFDLKMMPLLIPQVSIGSILGTEATARYFMANLGEDIGDLTLTGIGIRHSISQYLIFLPIDLSIGYFTQSFKVGDIVDAKAVYYGLQAGKTLGILSLYGGLGYESADVKVAYEQDTGDQVTKVSFDLESSNQMRITAGVGLNLSILKIHADYNLASQKTLCVGIGFGW